MNTPSAKAKFFVVCTGMRQFRVFERQGRWWGLVRTYPSAASARFCVERLSTGREPKPDIGKPPKRAPVSAKEPAS